VVEALDANADPQLTPLPPLRREAPIIRWLAWPRRAPAAGLAARTGSPIPGRLPDVPYVFGIAG